MSIAENHGGLYQNLRLLRETDGKAACNFFQAMGFDYFFVRDGNDFNEIADALEKVKNKFESTQIFGNINYLNVATNLAWFELLGRAEDMEKEVERYRAVTAGQLQKVAQSAFRKENGVILYYKKQIS